RECNCAAQSTGCPAGVDAAYCPCPPRTAGLAQEAPAGAATGADA
uniref:Cuticle collagen (Fragments) n=1 Tax=Caenorhabditis elegans TaxID=6239 RepID=Q9TXE7_CAEEL